MSAKIFSVRSAILWIALVSFISGCTPAGPRALLKGKKALARGELTAAVAQLETATRILATNAAAWNYYGVALQRAGQPAAAADAYATALRLDRDLAEAHFNLGCLRLEQNQPDAAKSEFTIFTQLRPKEGDGWLKLGSAQIKLNDAAAAEKSFSTAYHLDTNNPAALNGYGLTRILRGKPREAAQYFTSIIKTQPGFAPALLNLATVNQQYLHDSKAALENYRAYLAISPRAANWDEVNALATSLEQSPAAAPAPAPGAKANLATPAPELKPLPKNSNATVAARPPTAAPSEPLVKVTPPRQAPEPAKPTPIPVKVVAVATPPPIVVAPTADPGAAATPPATPAEPETEPAPEKKPGFWQRLLGSGKATNTSTSTYVEKGVTPLPASSELAARQAAAAAPVNFARYNYSAPAKPATGDPTAAHGAFTKAQVLEQGEKWVEAEQWYQRAATFDPAWFEAQFNTAVLAHRLRNYPLALAHYEQALAIRPEALEARYNFALALQAAGYVPDAANELNKVLAANPGEVRAQLALGNLYAQSLRNPSQARRHYLKVLELDPTNLRASDIRFWLAANPN